MAFKCFILLSIILAVLFMQMPWIDIFFQRIFFDPEQGFFLKHHWLVVALYKLVPMLVVSISILLLVILCLGIICRKDILPWLTRRHAIYLILVLAIGPGLLVNTVFKDQWGRARPSQISYFTGDKFFSPAWIISDQCERNCSFVSGHASVGFFLMAFGWVWSRYKLAFIALGTCMGSAVGLARIAQGGHFLSDVIFSGVIVALTCYLLAKFLLDYAKLKDNT